MLLFFVMVSEKGTSHPSCSSHLGFSSSFSLRSTGPRPNGSMGCAVSLGAGREDDDVVVRNRKISSKQLAAAVYLQIFLGVG